MSSKFEVYFVTGMFLGVVTKYRAEKAISYGIAARNKDMNLKAIFTDCGSMLEFEMRYKEAHKEYLKHKANCWGCGIEVSQSVKSRRPYCPTCSENKRLEEEKENEMFSRLRSKSMLERAFKMLEQQTSFININLYKEAGQAITDYIEKQYTKFDSSHEMVAAMELIRNEVYIVIQPIINNRKADFMLKEEKVILEIDGYMHEHSQVKDYKFDDEIRDELGLEWEIIRIPTNYIETNVTMLYEAIMKLKIYKQKLRKSNNGFIPDYYSKREEKVFNNLLNK